jgi:hypothetical protein
MIRRRRPTREIAFSFDSFLDVVANVVGIILRLILVAWVGARSYQAVVPRPALPQVPEPAMAELKLPEPPALPEPTDPLAGELERGRRALSAAEARLGKDLELGRQVSAAGQQVERELAELAGRRRTLTAARLRLKETAAEQAQAARREALSLEELKGRSRQLQEKIERLLKAPRSTHALRYRTPVSQPVHEEVMFECRNGRVTLIDIGALVEHMKRGLREKEEVLKTSWEARDVTPAVGAFRLRYVVERERTLMDKAAPSPPPGAYRYAATMWEVEPIMAERGEAAEAALAEGSVFRKVIDALDPQQTAVTLWVYADSFPLYRRLRDFLHDRDVMVAGRPLPDGVPIASSRHGTASRGQ